MTLYLDSSAIIKLFKSEPGSSRVRSMISRERECVTARHAFVEVMSTLMRYLANDKEAKISEFRELWDSLRVVEIDFLTCEIAASLADETQTRSLDAMHLAAMWRAGGSSLTMVTFDKRLAAATRHLGMPVADVA
ncbi:MAG: type II toxin-antitoxin system VapC family toxin [Thermoleophilia bacterium]|nr:type II toxin-antitoxin system VapC family toxin [Thermoleophilia bacterium]